MHRAAHGPEPEPETTETSPVHVDTAVITAPDDEDWEPDFLFGEDEEVRAVVDPKHRQRFLDMAGKPLAVQVECFRIFPHKVPVSCPDGTKAVAVAPEGEVWLWLDGWFDELQRPATGPKGTGRMLVVHVHFAGTWENPNWCLVKSASVRESTLPGEAFGPSSGKTPTQSDKWQLLTTHSRLGQGVEFLKQDAYFFFFNDGKGKPTTVAELEEGTKWMSLKESNIQDERVLFAILAPVLGRMKNDGGALWPYDEWTSPPHSRCRLPTSAEIEASSAMQSIRWTSNVPSDLNPDGCLFRNWYGDLHLPYAERQVHFQGEKIHRDKLPRCFYIDRKQVGDLVARQLEELSLNLTEANFPSLGAAEPESQPH